MRFAASASALALTCSPYGVPQDYVTAHMWFNVAAANGVEKAVSGRDSFAATMTQTDVSEAQRRARGCMASNYQDCD